MGWNESALRSLEGSRRRRAAGGLLERERACWAAGGRGAAGAHGEGAQALGR